MKLHRIILICLLVVLTAAPAAAEKLCFGTAKLVTTFPLSYQTAVKIRIEGASQEKYPYCLTHTCAGNFVATWTTSCGSGKKTGKVSSGHPVQWYAPMCEDGGTMAIMVTSGCIDVKVEYSRGF